MRGFWFVATAVMVIGAPLAGCTTTDGMAIKRDIDANTLPSGWTVRCTDDAYAAVRTCRAGKFGDEPNPAPFQVFFENGKGPFIQAGLNDFPGRTATVRVDSGKVRPQEDARGIVGDLINGQTALVTYNVWPTGQERMSVNISGFAEAYEKLKQIAGN